MNAPLYVMPPPTVPLPDAPPQPVPVVPQLLRELIALQEQQVGLLKAQAANHETGGRWRAFLARWAEEFPGVGTACKQALPALERAYLSLVREVTDRVNAAENGELEEEFALSEFLDRFGNRLGQLGNILGQLGPLADASGNAAEKGVGNDEKGLGDEEKG
jgi:hypothetical protein